MLRHHIRVALVQIRRYPAVTSINVCTLALGLLAFILAYGVVDFWDQAERQFPNAERTFVISSSIRLSDGTIALRETTATNPYVASYLQTDFPGLEATARARTIGRDAPVTAGERAVRLFSVAVDPAFLTIFDLPFIAGDARLALSAPRSVVLTTPAAERLFGRVDVLGKTVSFGNRVDATVTGVIAPIEEPSHLARSASAALPFDVLTSMDVLDRYRNLPNGGPENWFGIDSATYVLLPEDESISAEELAGSLDEFAARHMPAGQRAFGSLRLRLLPVSGMLALDASGAFLGGDIPLPGLLFAFASLVLLVACVSYANVATARVAERRHEAGVRKTMGAGARQIVVQHLFETGSLTVLATLAAIGAAYLVADPLRASSGIDLTLVLAQPLKSASFVVLLVTAVTLLGGIYPALVLARARPIGALRAYSLRSGSRLLSKLLVGLQFFVASFLLTAVIVVRLQNAELERLALALGDDPLLVIPDDVALTGLSMDTLSDELRRLPGVRAVTMMAEPLFGGSGASEVARSPDPSAAPKDVSSYGVSFDFADVLNVHILAGRVFDRSHGEDVMRIGQGRPNVVIDRRLSEELGFAAPAEAVGELIYLPADFARAFGQNGAVAMRVIGVVENEPLSIRGPPGTLYRFAAAPSFAVARLARGDAPRALEAIDALWKRLVPTVAPSWRFAKDNFEDMYSRYARLDYAFGAVAVFALSISIGGLLAMSLLAVAQRLREIGVRKCFGASRRRIVSMLLKDFSAPVVVANVLTWPFAFVAARRYVSLFLSPLALNLLPFAMAFVGTVTIAWLVVGSYALRASTAAPSRVLRHE